MNRFARRSLTLRSLLAFAVPALPCASLAQDQDGLAAPSAVMESPAAKNETQQRQQPQRRRRRSTRARAIRVEPVRPFTAPTSLTALNSDIRSMLYNRIRGGQWGVLVVSLTRGDTLYKHNADQMLSPASTMKLFTTAVALERLGPDHRFSTDVLRTGEIGPDGTLRGSLILRGDGDPAFSSRWVPGGYDAPVRALARSVATRGIKRISGNVIGDASAFTDDAIPEGWLSRYLFAGYAARVSALSLNENLVWVVVHPREGMLGKAAVTLEPASTTIPIGSAVRLVQGSRGGNIAVRRLPGGGYEARGWIGTNSAPKRMQLVVDDPAKFTTGAFVAALREEGIQVDGEATLGTTPPGAIVVASHQSPPLSRLLAVMNRESINHYAELIYRNAARGKDRMGPGTADRAFAFLREQMRHGAEIPVNELHATDGSGLSSLDKFTPRALVHMLSYAHSAPWSDTFHASLPVAGESELLRQRMRATPAQGNLHAKTGTTNTVASLGGYVTSRNGEILAFAFIYNGTDRWNAKMTMDQLGATLAAFGRD